MLLQMILARALKLPYRLADHVKSKRLHGGAGKLDFVFNVVGLNRLVAQPAELAGPITAPHSRGRFGRQLSRCDALACDEPQFLFESGERHSQRAER